MSEKLRTCKSLRCASKSNSSVLNFTCNPLNYHQLSNIWPSRVHWTCACHPTPVYKKKQSINEWAFIYNEPKIEQQTYNNIHLNYKIRNHFAHSMTFGVLWKFLLIWKNKHFDRNTHWVLNFMTHCKNG